MLHNPALRLRYGRPPTSVKPFRIILPASFALLQIWRLMAHLANVSDCYIESTQEQHLEENLMKRLSSEERERLKRRSSVRAAKAMRRAKRKLPASRSRSPNAHTSRPRSCILRAPERFNLLDQDARSKLVEFLASLRRAAGRREPRVRIDLSCVEKMQPAGALLFAAELMRLQEDPQVVTKFGCIPPRQTKPLHVFKQLGLLERLGWHGKVDPKGVDVVNWRLASGDDVRGEKFEETLGPYNGMLAAPLEEGLYKGFIEAMKNSKHHAYCDSREDGLDVTALDGNWWMLSQLRNGNLFVAFCDLGVGIPRSLPKTWPESTMELLRQMVTMRSWHYDARLIEAATRVGRSRTERPERGKGLRHICEDVMGNGGGSVVIHSNHGRYEMVATDEGGPKIKLANYRDSIMGTIISWKVKLHKDDHGA